MAESWCGVGRWGVIFDSELVGEHQRMWESSSEQGLPYWELPPRLGNWEAYVRNGLIVTIAYAGALAPQHLAEIVELGAETYIRRGLFGEVENEAREKLLPPLMGMRDDRVVVSVADVKQRQIVGGCMIVRGDGKRLAKDEIGQPDSILPTLWALQADWPKPYGQTQASQVVNFTRCFRRADYQGDPRHLSMEVLSGMGRVIRHWEDKEGRATDLGILDTHDPRVVKTLVEHYGGQVWDEAPTMAAHVQASPLARHYKMPVQVVGFEAEKQMRLAEQVDRALGLKIPVMPHALLASWEGVR